MTHRYMLWGWTERFGLVTPSPIRIASGNLRDCKSRERQFRADYGDALTGIYAQGDQPEGLILQVRARTNCRPTHQPTGPDLRRDPGLTG